MPIPLPLKIVHLLPEVQIVQIEFDEDTAQLPASAYPCNGIPVL